MSGEGILLKIEDIFHNTIDKYKMLKKGDAVVVGLSGGPDSIALFHLLYRFKDYYDINLITAHLNHNFRPGDAEKDAEYVKEFCKCRNIPCIIEFCDVPALAKKEGLSGEQAGRKARYSFFNRVMKDNGCNRIAIAHNQNDQVETVLMRLIRGSGMEGLTGIHHVRGNIIRPLLEIPRKMIDEYCGQHDLNPVIDKTNLKPVYERNKIRLELLPYLRSKFNKNIDRIIIDTAYILKDENNYLNEVAFMNFQEVLISSEENGLILDLRGLNKLHDALLRRVLRLAVEKLKGNKNNLEYTHIDALYSMLKRGHTGKRIHLPGKITASLSYGKLLLTTGNNVIKTIDNIYYLKIPGVTPIDELRGVLEAAILTKDDYKNEREAAERLTAYFDFYKTGEQIVLRKRKSGDKFKPLGMEGSKKLKDFFIDLKIPREERNVIPVIHNGEAIIWVMGYRICDDFKIDASTRTILKLSFKRLYEEE